MEVVFVFFVLYMPFVSSIRLDILTNVSISGRAAFVISFLGGSTVVVAQV